MTPAPDHDTRSPHLQLLRRSGGDAAPVLEEIQRDLVALPGVGMSMLEISHRSKTFEAILAQAEADMRDAGGHSGQLQGAVPAGRRQHAVLDGADEPARRGQTADYIDTGSWADKAIKEAKKVGAVNVAATTKADNYSRIPEARGAEAHAGRGLRAHDLEQHDRGHGVSSAARRRRRAARQRHLVGHVQPADRRRAARAHLRGRAEEHGPRRRDDRHHPRGSPRALRQRQGVAADDAELCGACGERLALQHAAGLRGLRARAGHEVADRAGRARGHRRAKRAKAAKLYAEIDRTGFYRGTARKEAAR